MVKGIVGNYEVFDDWKGVGLEWFNYDGIVVFKVVYVQLIGSCILYRAMWFFVDDYIVGIIDVFLVIVFKGNWFFFFGDQVFIEDVQYFQE